MLNNICVYLSLPKTSEESMNAPAFFCISKKMKAERCVPLVAGSR